MTWVAVRNFVQDTFGGSMVSVIFYFTNDAKFTLNSDYGAGAVPVVPTLGARRIALFE